uniref:Importin-13 isoform X3 n=1 Tax=Rhizophora mucronata TaxID=61149 RepID=A0A2P2LXD1_RHIMU
MLEAVLDLDVLWWIGTQNSSSYWFLDRTNFWVVVSGQVWDGAMTISKFSNQMLQNSSPFPLHMPTVFLTSIAALALKVI